MECQNGCGAVFDPNATHWWCPRCKYKHHCCEGGDVWQINPVGLGVRRLVRPDADPAVGASDPKPAPGSG